MSGLDAPLLVPLTYGFFVLWASRRAFSLRTVHVIQLLIAAVFASVTVYVDAIYFPHGVIEWAVTVPRWYDDLSRSQFTESQEMLLALFWSCYVVISFSAWSLNRGRKKKLS